jgi:alkaline phosphatase
MLTNLKNRFTATVLACVLIAVTLVGCTPVYSESPADNSGTQSAGNPKAKNVIVMISDGASFKQYNAASIYENGRPNSEVYQNFPFRFAMSTYPAGGSYDSGEDWKDFDYVKWKPTDSAAASTAMSSGVKTYKGAIGVNRAGKPVQNVLEAAEEQGKSTGVVTSVEFSHATPAGFVAHNVSRDNYEAIAKEMLLDSATDVIMGAGNPWFDDNAARQTSPNSYKYVGGKQTWDRLVAGTAGADADGDGRRDPWKLIQSRAEFLALAQGAAPDRVVGIPHVYTTLQQARSGKTKAAPYAVTLNKQVPTLVEMTAGALNVLDNNQNGLFLMVEGGAVDWAATANQPGRLIEEQSDFNRAVEVVINWVETSSSWDETLLIVTADHESGYLTGPDSDPAWQPLVNKGAGVQPGLEFHSAAHTNSLVPVYAKGTHARALLTYADETDSVHGPYIDNTELGKLLFEVLN